MVRNLLAVKVTLPLWAGCLVKLLAMRVTFTAQGLFNWLLEPLGISGPGFGIPVIILTLPYLWLPYVALPIFSAIRKLPHNLLDASADLGARAGQPYSGCTFPLFLPQ
jgi:putative spermidine/putrescine transport system permease protein